MIIIEYYSIVKHYLLSCAKLFIMNKNIFQKRFIEAINNSGMKQKDIAIKANIDKSCITQYKKGDSEPSLDTLYKLCKILDITADYLLGLED